MDSCRKTQFRIGYNVQLRGTVQGLKVSTDWLNNSYYFAKHSCIVVTLPHYKNRKPVSVGRKMKKKILKSYL